MTKELQNQPVIAQYLERFKDQIVAALPKHMTADRMSRIVMTEVRKTPKLLQCDPKSLFGAVIQASQIGLEPGSAMGHCYLIPYGKNVNLIIGYRGMIDLARRSGQIISIEARVVYRDEKFSYSFGLNPDLQHTPSSLAVKDRGPVTHYYAIARLVGGGVQWDVMTIDEVNEIRDNTPGGGKTGPWKTHPVPMGQKTVVRRLFKFLPVSIEMQSAVGLDEMADSGVDQQNSAVIAGEFTTIDDIEETEPDSKTEAIKEKLRKKIEESEVDPETGEIISDAPEAK